MNRENFTGMVETLQGRLGDEIGYMVRGRQRWRRYVKPYNPRTKRQRSRRKAFARLVSRWHGLDGAEKALWNARAAGKPFTGFNLFISSGMKEFEAAQRVLEIKASVRSSRRFVRVKKQSVYHPLVYFELSNNSGIPTTFQYRRE